MHIYIYDSFLANKKYDSKIAKIETRLTDLGLNGKIIRLGLLQSLNDSVRNELRKGAKTIVAVGNIKLLHQCINAVIGYYEDYELTNQVPVGFIPMDTKLNAITEKLGIPIDVDACNILSARRIEKIDLGKINNNYFFTEAVIETIGTTVSVDNSYTIEIDRPGKIAIINLANEFKLPTGFLNSPKDGLLEFCIETKSNGGFLPIGQKDDFPSVFKFNSLHIHNKNNLPFLVDSVTEIKTPAEVKISKKAIDIIIGKSRFF